MNRGELIQMLNALAKSLDKAGVPSSAGIVRQAARLLAEDGRRLGELEAPSDQDGCAWCGRPIQQPATGHPRRYCSDTHRAAASRKSRKSKLVS